MQTPLRRGVTLVVAASALTTGLFLAEAPARAAVKTSSTALPPAPVQTAAVSYSDGRAYLSWSPGSGAQSISYRITTFLLGANGTTAEGTVGAVGTDAVVNGLQVGAVYDFAVSAVNNAGSGPASTTNQITAVGSLVPGAPTDVTLTAAGGDNEVTVSWQPSPAAPAAEHYDIGVYEGSGSTLHQVGAVTCTAPCASQTLQAGPGTTTTAIVDAANSVGRSGSVWSNPVTVAQPCPLACLSVSTSNAGGAEARPSDGFLIPNGPSAQSSPLTALGPKQWRTDAATLAVTTPAPLAALQGSAITDLLSNDWLAAHNIGGYAITPWSDWSLYSQWVTTDVQQVEALGRQEGFQVTYWDVQNEPFGGYYYSDSSLPPASETIANFEQQFLVAYRAIKAADPSAQVIGPSAIDWAARPADAGSGIDMRTFLDFCVTNGIQLGGVSFHDDLFGTLPGWYAADHQPAQPSEVQWDLAQLRKMLADRPSLGHPAILVNEYGDPYTYQLPGWDVGRIASLDAAQVTGANRSCWADCGGGSLDGILASDGSTPLPGYWVYSFYAGMTGTTVPVTSTYTDVTGLAAVDGTGTVRALVGRHQSCTTVVNPYCPSYPAGQATVRVQVPGASSARVSMAAIPMGSTTQSPLASLSTTTATATVVNGWVTIATPSLGDGDAVEITVTPV